MPHKRKNSELNWDFSFFNNAFNRIRPSIRLIKLELYIRIRGLPCELLKLTEK